MGTLPTWALLPPPAAEHMLYDATDWRDLVVELPALVGVLGLKDGLTLPRLM